LLKIIREKPLKFSWTLNNIINEPLRGVTNT
jgi:hypothetical protein